MATQLSIVCILLICLVFILLAIIMAFLYDKYLKKRNIFSTITERKPPKPRNRRDIEEDIESVVFDTKGAIDHRVIGDQSFPPQSVNDFTQTSVKTYKCSTSSPQLKQHNQTEETEKISKAAENSPQNDDIFSAKSEHSMISSQYLSQSCSQKPFISHNNLMENNNNSATDSIITGNNVSDSVLNSTNRYTLPKRMHLSSAHSFSRTDDIIMEMDAIIDQSFDSMKSTIDCMNYDTLRYSNEDLS